MGITIRTAAPDDATAACAVLRRSIEESCQLDHQNDSGKLDAWLGNKTPQTVSNWMASPSNHMLVAERDGAVVGVALVTQAGKLALCYVLPEAQRCGVGTALLAGAEAKARAWGIGVLSLKSTAAACAFYAHHGYASAGKETTCYGLDCDLFWKQLDAVAGDGAAGKRFCSCNSA